MSQPVTDLDAALAEIQSLKAAFAGMCEQRDAATEALEKIGAQNDALTGALAWAVGTMQKAAQHEDRGGGAVCWDAFNSHEGYAARLLIGAASTRAEETLLRDPEAELAFNLFREPFDAQIAALRASLKWAIDTFQGESGCGDAYWEQFPEYLAACALLADTQSEEETP